MITDDFLREAAPDATAMRSHTDRVRADVLARAVPATPRSHTRSRAVLGTAVAAVLSLGTIGGVAYAAGSVPDLFASSVDGFAKQIGVGGDQTPELRQVTDLALPDGSRFAVWSGRSDSMVCTAYLDNWDGSTRPKGSGGATCDDQVSETVRPSLFWAQGSDLTTYYPVVFGDAGADVVEVRISGTFRGTGEPVDLVLPVDPSTASFAVTLPGTLADPWPTVAPEDHQRVSGLTLRFVGADGQVVTTVDGLAY